MIHPAESAEETLERQRQARVTALTINRGEIDAEKLIKMLRAAGDSAGKLVLQHLTSLSPRA